MGTDESGSSMAPAVLWEEKEEKVSRVFLHFDADGDGGLDREEMAALVAALNSRIRFTKDQMDDIVGEVFRLYSKAVGPGGARRVTLDALLCIYDDVAGVYHDLGRILDHAPAHEAPQPTGQQRHAASPSVDSSLASSSFRSEAIWEFVDDRRYAPQSEYEEIPSFRWLSPSPSPPRSAFQLEARAVAEYGKAGAVHRRGGIRSRLGTFYGLTSFRRKS